MCVSIFRQAVMDSSLYVLYLEVGPLSADHCQNGTWSRQNLGTEPDPRLHHAMAYDSNSQASELTGPGMRGPDTQRFSEPLQALWIHGGQSTDNHRTRDFWKFEVHGGSCCSEAQLSSLICVQGHPKTCW